MNDSNELFPFPLVPESGKADNQNSETTSLPAFPGSSDSEESEAPLTSAELRGIRQLLVVSRANRADEEIPATPITPVAPVAQITVAPATVAVQAEMAVKPEKILQQQLATCWKNLRLSEPCEIEVRNQLIEIIENIADMRILSCVWGAANSLLPLKHSLRHGTPDQKIFTLIMLGERFLQSLAGISFNERKRLIKTVARYLSEVSETCSFIQMEGEPFNQQYHERAPGSMPSGKSVREMHSFLVTSRSSNQVVKTALVLT
ncbi:MAG: hypothetical protein KKB51_05420 [Candidatus Riflebacteria bacterium]|nr:hypothetical protein [Candidatus Riflebacteria bacterium]